MGFNMHFVGNTIRKVNSIASNTKNSITNKLARVQSYTRSGKSSRLGTDTRTIEEKIFGELEPVGWVRQKAERAAEAERIARGNAIRGNKNTMTNDEISRGIARIDNRSTMINPTKEELRQANRAMLKEQNKYKPDFILRDKAKPQEVIDAELNLRRLAEAEIKGTQGVSNTTAGAGGNIPSDILTGDWKKYGMIAGGGLAVGGLGYGLLSGNNNEKNRY